MKTFQLSRFLAFALVLSLGAWVAARTVRQSSKSGESTTLCPGVSALTLSNLLSMPLTELSRVDISLMNLLCVTGLAGSEGTDVPLALAELERMAHQVKAETERHYRKFRAHPEEFNGSETYFRMLCLVTVLQQDFGVGYSPHHARSSDGPIEPNEAFFADSRDIFLNGLLGSKRTGTCASMPVLYVAVGRRLGYPLKLVVAKNHLFARWEDGRERLNIEATTQGLTTFDDDYYRRWPFPMTADEEKSERYLTSLGSAEELSVFLSLRTQCLLATGRWDEALFSQEQVCRLAPYSANQREILERVRSQTKHRRNQNHQTTLNL